VRTQSGWAGWVVGALAIATTGAWGGNQYLYDDAGRLKSVIFSNGKASEYTYDDAGNRRSVQTSAGSNSVVSIGQPAYSISEGGQSLAVQIVRTGAISGAASVDCISAPQSAGEGTDYSPPTNGTVFWGAGDGTSKSCTYTIHEDPDAEGDETFEVSLGNASGTLIGSPPSAIVTIADNDEPGGMIQFSTQYATVSEGVGTASIPIQRVGGSSGRASIRCTSTENGSADDPSDYTGVDYTINWPSGDSNTKFCQVPIINDTLTEGDETFLLTLSEPTGASLGSPSNSTVTISANDSGNGGQIAFDAMSAVVTERDTTLHLDVTRLGSSSGMATVRCVAVDGTGANGAQAGTDFEARDPDSMFWPDGVAITKTCDVVIKEDSLWEPNETFTVELMDATGATIGNPSSMTITIEDDDAPTGSISFTSSAINVAESAPYVDLQVQRTGGSYGAASVRCATNPPSSQLTGDFDPLDITLNWTDGNSAQKQCRVYLNDDTEVEGNETFSVSLSLATGASLGGPAVQNVTIIDDDTASSVLSFSPASYVKLEGFLGSLTVTVARTGSASGAVSVQYQTVNGSAVGGQDFSSTSGTLNWSSGDSAKKSFTVQIINDSAAELDETFTLKLSNPTGGAVLGSQSTATVMIPCNDGGNCQ
jgi:YD repeat-containing protein